MASRPIVVRPEEREDYPVVRGLVRRAFGREDEARLVEALRESPGFVPALSLVAETGGRVVGHILFSPVGTSGGGTVLALAPVAVDPSFQRRGVGPRSSSRGFSRAGSSATASSS